MSDEFIGGGVFRNAIKEAWITSMRHALKEGRFVSNRTRAAIQNQAFDLLHPEIRIANWQSTELNFNHRSFTCWSALKTHSYSNYGSFDEKLFFSSVEPDLLRSKVLKKYKFKEFIASQKDFCINPALMVIKDRPYPLPQKIRVVVHCKMNAVWRAGGFKLPSMTDVISKLADLEPGKYKLLGNDIQGF